MSSSQSRIGTLALVFLLIAAVVVGHLFYIMVMNHDVWAARSHRNRWAFRSVPSLRGAIHDRHGRVLVHDEPTMEVSLFYLRFRLRHPVGSAVHGATAWARLQSGRALVTYGYRDGVLGPTVAARDLLAMPVAVLRRGKLEREEDAAMLATAMTTVLSGTTGMSRRRVFTALREAAEATPELACGDALPGFTAADVLAEYDRLLGSLRRFEAELEAASATGTRSPGLIERLEWARRASLDERSLMRKGKDGAEEPGEKIENIEWPVAEDVPFAMAAPLQVGMLAHPGLRVRPGVRRVSALPAGGSLHALLGAVSDVGRSEPDAEWIDRYVAREMPELWLEDVVPDEAAVSDVEREQMRENAVSSFKQHTRRYERRGTSGVERAADDTLCGRLGMRLVERDSKQREQRMWGNLRVKSGQDVVITIDGDLQFLAEQVVTAARVEMARQHADADDAKRCRAALAIIDAHSGDVLAFAGDPVEGRGEWAVPGVSWATNGSLGSVVKPFVLIEQLQAEAMGRPCLPLASIEPCSKNFKYRGQQLGCGHAHWDAGKDPVTALAQSCNLFFYQAAVGLGDEGVLRALQRFGLSRTTDAEFAPCWQTRVLGFRWANPRVLPKLLPTRAIGYGVEASPLAVARAYAGIATGRLPTLSLLQTPPRKVVVLSGIDRELDVTRRGLAACVQSGTAKGVTALSRPEFRVLGKTGTAQVGPNVAGHRENNAWFAGYLPWTTQDGIQLCFCSVIYWVPDGVHGAEAAGGIVASVLERAYEYPELRVRYIEQRPQ